MISHLILLSSRKNPSQKKKKKAHVKIKLLEYKIELPSRKCNAQVN